MTLMLPFPNVLPYLFALTIFPPLQLEFISHYSVLLCITYILFFLSKAPPSTYCICICSWFLWLLHVFTYIHLRIGNYEPMIKKKHVGLSLCFR